MKTALFAAMVLAIAPAIAGAQVYKWVDEKGAIHYGSRPDGKNARVLPLPDSSDRDGPSAETELQRREREFQKRHEARQKEEQRAQEERARRERDRPWAERDRMVECRRASRDLSAILQDSRSYTYTDEARARDKVSRYCR